MSLLLQYSLMQNDFRMVGLHTKVYHENMRHFYYSIITTSLAIFAELCFLHHEKSIRSLRPLWPMILNAMAPSIIMTSNEHDQRIQDGTLLVETWTHATQTGIPRLVKDASNSIGVLSCWNGIN